MVIIVSIIMPATIELYNTDCSGFGLIAYHAGYDGIIADQATYVRHGV